MRLVSPEQDCPAGGADSSGEPLTAQAASPRDEPSALSGFREDDPEDQGSSLAALTPLPKGAEFPAVEASGERMGLPPPAAPSSSRLPGQVVRGQGAGALVSPLFEHVCPLPAQVASLQMGIHPVGVWFGRAGSSLPMGVIAHCTGTIGDCLRDRRMCPLDGAGEEDGAAVT